MDEHWTYSDLFACHEALAFKDSVAEKSAKKAQEGV